MEHVIRLPHSDTSGRVLSDSENQDHVRKSGRLFAKNAKDGAPIVLVMPARSKAWATRQNVVGFGWTNAAFLALLHALPPEVARKLAAEQTTRAD